MREAFHAGEIEVQQRAGLRREARAVGRIIASGMAGPVRRFLAAQRMAVAASLDARGGVWASLLTGPPGFLRASGERVLEVETLPAAGDPLPDNLRLRPELGLLVIDLSTRQRVRLNGRGVLAPHAITLLTEQVYGNCPKYIRSRGDAGGEPGPAGEPLLGTSLDPRQRRWIESADTLFIASFHPQGGADASHRGGPAGFVRVAGPDRLSFPDYAGNALFNTLGNLAGYPRAGLLFVDFANGDLLQLSGRTRILPDFSVELRLEAVRETRGGSPLRLRALEAPVSDPPASRRGPRGISSE